MGFFIIFVLMLKPLYIICLLALLGMGFVACEKDGVLNPIIQSVPYIIINDTSEYDNAHFYVNSTVLHFPDFNVPDTLYYFLDNDTIDDLKFVKVNNTYPNGGYYVGVSMYDLSSGQTLAFSARPNWSAELNAHMLTDTVDENINWSDSTHFPINWGDYSNPPAEYWYIYNWSSQTNKMVGFRKQVGSEYKYGWIIIDVVNGAYGPSVMQR